MGNNKSITDETISWKLNCFENDTNSLNLFDPFRYTFSQSSSSSGIIFFFMNRRNLNNSFNHKNWTNFTEMQSSQCLVITLWTDIKSAYKNIPRNILPRFHKYFNKKWENVICCRMCSNLGEIMNYFNESFDRYCKIKLRRFC